MKLRIRGNSLRLRLDKTEMAQLASAGTVMDTVRFGPDAVLQYSLSVRAQAAPLAAAFDGGHVRVFISQIEAAQLIETDAVGVNGEQDASSELLRLLVEKDFSCLQVRPYEDDAHAFPNPRHAHDCQPQ